MITKTDKSVIKQFLQSPQWKVIQEVLEEYINRLKDQSNLRDTEWETAKAVAFEEGQIQGIKSLIQELYKLAD